MRPEGVASVAGPDWLQAAGAARVTRAPSAAGVLKVQLSSAARVGTPSWPRGSARWKVNACGAADVRSSSCSFTADPDGVYCRSVAVAPSRYTTEAPFRTGVPTLAPGRLRVIGPADSPTVTRLDA